MFWCTLIECVSLLFLPAIACLFLIFGLFGLICCLSSFVVFGVWLVVIVWWSVVVDCVLWCFGYFMLLTLIRVCVVICYCCCFCWFDLRLLIFSVLCIGLGCLFGLCVLRWCFVICVWWWLLRLVECLLICNSVAWFFYMMCLVGVLLFKI